MSLPRRIAHIPISAVLPLISSPLDNNSTRRALIYDYWVGTSSTRLRVFRKYGTRCAACGLEATTFVIERHEDGNYSLGLYGGKLNDILFTHDHIIARALGGSNTFNNMQPMCTICNKQKSIIENLVLKMIHDPHYTHVDKRVRDSLRKARKNEWRKTSEKAQHYRASERRP